MKKKRHVRPKPKLDPAGEGYPVPIRGLLTLGKPKDSTPYTEWAERLRDYVPQLVQMALDPDLNKRPQQDKAIWAPIHALNILAVLAPPEAVEPVLELLAWDDEWVDEPIIEFFAAIGADAIPPLQALLVDEGGEALARERAISALGEIAKRNAAQRDEIARAADIVSGPSRP